jgi:tetratricopeptide (TPR) repeat protein
MESDVAQLGIPDRLLAWFALHKQAVLWSAGVLVAAGVGTGFLLWRQQESQRQANDALSRITSVGFTAAEPLAQPEALLKVAADHPNTDGAGRALLLAGASLYAQEKHAEAKAQFERFLRQYRESPFADQALLGVAACLDAQGKTGEAITAYNDIVQHYSMQIVAPQAKLALARLYAKQGKFQQAKDLYTDLTRSQYGSLSSEAAIYLEALTAAHPELVSARTASTNAPTLQPFKP